MRAPAFQFYPGDWVRDPQLQMAPTVARGVWINALCRMWDNEPRGTLSGTREEIARLCLCTKEDLEVFLEAVKRCKFADLTIRDGDLTLINRRMVRDEKARQGNANRQRRHYNNHKPNAGLTPPSHDSSSSSSSSSSKKEKDTSLADARFGEFWNVYPKKVDKQEALESWRRIDPALFDSIIADAGHRWASYGKDDKQFIPGPAKYLRKRKWTDEVILRNGSNGAAGAAVPDSMPTADDVLRSKGLLS